MPQMALKRHSGSFPLQSHVKPLYSVIYGNTYTHHAAKKYGIASTSFERYLKELKDGGFIEKVENEDLAQYAPGKYSFSGRREILGILCSPNWGRVSPKMGRVQGSIYGLEKPGICRKQKPKIAEALKKMDHRKCDI